MSKAVTEAPFSESTPVKFTLKALAALIGAIAIGLGAWFTTRDAVASNTEDIKAARIEAHREVETLRSDTKERLDQIRTEQHSQRVEQQQQRDILMRIDERTRQLAEKKNE